jgi:hypothetical protein
MSDATQESTAKADIREVAIAICILLFGLFVTWRSIEYGLGTSRQLGSGAIPAALGFASICLGLVMWARARHGGAGEHSLEFRPLLSTIMGMGIWALAAPRFGLAPATICLIAISSFGQPIVRPLEVAILAIVMSAVGAVVFIYGLGVPLHVTKW